MIPATFTVLDALPLTPNGKLDRRALPAPDRRRRPPATSPPRTPAEQAIAAIWADVLGLDQVGIHDNFFELGGDSILSIQIVSRARQAGLEPAAQDIFRHQTIAELRLEDSRSASRRASSWPGAGERAGAADPGAAVVPGARAGPARSTLTSGWRWNWPRPRPGGAGAPRWARSSPTMTRCGCGSPGRRRLAAGQPAARPAGRPGPAGVP